MSQKQIEARMAERRAKVADMYVRGWSQLRIAKALGVNKKTIITDLVALRAEWREARIHDMDALVSQELLKIDEVEREAWEAWERSQKDAKAKTVVDNQKNGKTTTVSREGQYGDPRFLQIAQGCIERRCKLLGLDAPTKNETKLDTGGQRPLTREEMFATIMERVNKLTIPSDN